MCELAQVWTRDSTLVPAIAPSGVAMTSFTASSAPWQWGGSGEGGSSHNNPQLMARHGIRTYHPAQHKHSNCRVPFPPFSEHAGERVCGRFQSNAEGEPQ